MAGAWIDPPVGKHARSREGREQPIAVAEHHLAGEVTDLREFPRLLDDVGDRAGLRLAVGPLDRSHADRLARLGELLVEPFVAGVIDRHDEVATDGEILNGGLEDVAGELSLAILRQRYDGEVVGPDRHVGHALGGEIRWRRRPRRLCRGARVEIVKPRDDRSVGPLDGE